MTFRMVRHIGLVAVAVVVLAASVVPATATVISAPTAYGGHSYYLLAPTTWVDAEAEAVTLGGHLVTINDAAENAFVESTFSGPAGTGGIWIGLNDVASEGTFVWASGEAVTYTNWQAGEPNNATVNSPSGEDYGHMYAFAGTWNDVHHVGGFAAVVEIASIVPAPATGMLLAAGVTIGAAVRRRRAR